MKIKSVSRTDPNLAGGKSYEASLKLTAQNQQKKAQEAAKAAPAAVSATPAVTLPTSTNQAPQTTAVGTPGTYTAGTRIQSNYEAAQRANARNNYAAKQAASGKTSSGNTGTSARLQSGEEAAKRANARKNYEYREPNGLLPSQQAQKRETDKLTAELAKRRAAVRNSQVDYLQNGGTAGSKRNQTLQKAIDSLDKQMEGTETDYQKHVQQRQKNTAEALRYNQKDAQQKAKEAKKQYGKDSAEYKQAQQKSDEATKAVWEAGLPWQARVANYADAVGGRLVGTLPQVAATLTRPAQNEIKDNKFSRRYVAMNNWLQNAADYAYSVSEKGNTNLKYGLGTVGRTAADVAVTGGEMVSDALMNAIVPGSSMVAMGVRAGAQGANEAHQAGATAGQEFTYGVATAGVELLTEKMFDGFAKVYGSGAADDIVEGIVGRLAETNGGRTLARTLINAPGEGVEEVVSDLVNPLIKYIYDNGAQLEESYGTGEGFKEMMKEAGYDFLVGAILGLGGSAASMLNGQNATQNAVLALQDDFVDRIRSSETNTSSFIEPNSGQTTNFGVEQYGDTWWGHAIDGKGKTYWQGGYKSRSAAERATAKAATEWIVKQSADTEAASKDTEVRARDNQRAEVAAENPGATVADGQATDIQRALQEAGAADTSLAHAVKLSGIVDRILNGDTKLSNREILSLDMYHNSGLLDIVEQKLGVRIDTSSNKKIVAAVREAIARRAAQFAAEDAQKDEQAAAATEAQPQAVQAEAEQTTPAEQTVQAQEETRPVVEENAQNALQQAAEPDVKAGSEGAANTANASVASENAVVQEASARESSAAQASPTESGQANSATKSNTEQTITMNDGRVVTRQQFIDDIAQASTRAERFVASAMFDSLYAMSTAGKTQQQRAEQAEEREAGTERGPSAERAQQAANRADAAQQQTEAKQQKAETAADAEQPTKGTEQKPGLVRDEYTASHDEHEMNIIDNVAKRLGVTVRFVDSVLGGKANAQHENGVIEIEKHNRNPVLFLFGHELTHYLQEVSPDSYQAFCDAAMMGTPNANAIIRGKIRLYEKNGVKLERKDAIDELAADYAGQMMDNLNVLERFIERHGENRTLLQHLADAFRSLIDRVGGRYRVNAKNAVTLLEKALDDGARAVDKAERQKAKENAATKGGERNYSFEELTAKPDMAVTQIDDTTVYQANSETRKNIISRAISAAKEIGQTNANGNAVVRVEDLNSNVILSANGLRHGLDRRLSVNAPVILKAGEILQNAVCVNELIPKKGNVDAAFVLVGMAKNENNEPYIVRFIVNRVTSEVTSVDVLYAVNAKKEPGALLPEIAGVPATLTGSTISIANLLQRVNRIFPDVLSLDVLQHFGRVSRPAGEIGNRARYSFGRLRDAELERKAESMENEGKTPERIWQALGVARTMDGDGWRYEFDDSKIKLRQTGYNIPNLIKLGELVDAPELFAVYPDLADIGLSFSELMPGVNGGYDKRHDQITINSELRGNMEKLQDVLIHEVQHAIQNREGFPGGANPAYWAKKIGGDNWLGEDIGWSVLSYTKRGKDLQKELDAFRNNPENAKLIELWDRMDELDPDDDAQFEEWLRLGDEIDSLGLRERDREYTNLRLPDAKADHRTAAELYRDTAGEIEARDAAKRREQTAEQRRATAPDLGNEDTVFAGSGNSYAIGKTTGNKPFVEVEQDILASVPEADWVKTVKENLKQKFPNGIPVGNNEIYIDKQSRREMTFSRYIQWLYKNDPKLRADKLRATNNADEILLATTDWVNEGLNHPRKDKIIDFARGNVLLRVGGNDYVAEVVVGARENGSMLLYDILNLQPTFFTEKETDAAITANPSPGASRSTASVSANSVAENGLPVKKRFSIDEPMKDGTEPTEGQFSMKNDDTHERLRQHLADAQREQNESAWDRLGAKITDEIKAAVQDAGVANSEVEQLQRALALRDAGATADEIRDETHLDSNPDGSLEYMDLFEGDTVTVWTAEDEQRRKAAQGEGRAAAKASQKGAAKQSTRKRTSDTARSKPYTAYAFAKRITSGDVQCDFDKHTIADSVRKIGLLLQKGNERQAAQDAYSMAMAIVTGSYVDLNEDNAETRKELRSYLQQFPVYVSNTLARGMGKDEITAKRKGSLAFMTTSNSSSSAIDQIYPMLTRTFGEDLFPSDIIVQEDQLDQLGRALKALEPHYENPYGRNPQDWEPIAMDLAGEILDAAEQLPRSDLRKVDAYIPMTKTAEFQAFREQYDKAYGDGAADAAIRTAEAYERALRRAEERRAEQKKHPDAAKTRAENARILEKSRSKSVEAKQAEFETLVFGNQEKAKEAVKLRKKNRDLIEWGANYVQQAEAKEARAEQRRERQLSEQAEHAELMKARAVLREKFRASKTLMSAKIRAGRNLERQKRKTERAVEWGKQTLRETRMLTRRTAKDAMSIIENSRKPENLPPDQGEINTLRGIVPSKTKAERRAERIEALKRTGRKLYAAFVADTATLEDLSTLQVREGAEGLTAYESAKIAKACNSTIEMAYQDGLYNASGDRIAGPLKEAAVCWKTVNGVQVVDEELQAIFQDYRLHLHNIDRMSLRQKALNAVAKFETENPWLRGCPTRELALIAEGAYTEKGTLTDPRRPVVLQYVQLLKKARDTKDKPIFSDSNGNPVTADSSRQIVAEYEKNYPDIVKKSEEMDAWWDAFMRTYVVGTSISAEDYAVMRDTYPHYTPTYRVDKGQRGRGVYAGGGTVSTSAFVKKATGSLKEVRYIEDSYADLVARAIRQNRTNAMCANIIETAMNDDSGAFENFAVFDWAEQRGVLNKLGMLEDRDGLDGSEAHEPPALEKDGNTYRVSCWIDGERISAYISEELYNSLQSVIGTNGGSGVERAVSTFTMVGNKLTSPMKTLITGINPLFGIRNFIRDVPTAIVNSHAGGRILTYLPRAIKLSKTNSAEWQTYCALGGTSQSYYRNENGRKQGNAIANWDNSASMTVKGKLERGAKKAAEAVGWFNELTENAVRFSEYLCTIDNLPGGDTYENRVRGIYYAGEVSVDFSRRGSLGRTINAWIPYWNPAMQGIDKVIRSCVLDVTRKNSGLKQAGVTIARAVLTTAMPEALLAAVRRLLNREDEWEELSDYVKDNYYCVPLPGVKNENKFLKLPKNREWAALIANPLWRIVAGIEGRDDPFANYWDDSIAANFIPPAAWEAIGIEQYLALKHNEDYAGSPIVGNQYKDYTTGEYASKKLQYDGDTTLVAKALSDAMFNALSPEQVDYVLHSYCGDIGDLVFGLVDMDTWSAITGDAPEGYSAWHDLYELVTAGPMKFVADNRYSNAATSKYYDTMDELGSRVADAKVLDPDGYTESTDYELRSAMQSNYGKRIQSLNKQVRETADGPEKDALKAELAATAQEAMDFYNAVQDGAITQPKQYVAYDKAGVSPTVRDALLSLDSLADDYKFEPSGFSAKGTISAGNGKEWRLDESQKQEWRDIFADEYNERAEAMIGSARYIGATDAEKADMLEGVYEDATKAAKESIIEWMQAQGYSPVQKGK